MGCNGIKLTLHIGTLNEFLRDSITGYYRMSWDIKAEGFSGWTVDLNRMSIPTIPKWNHVIQIAACFLYILALTTKLSLNCCNIITKQSWTESYEGFHMPFLFLCKFYDIYLYPFHFLPSLHTSLLSISPLSVCHFLTQPSISTFLFSNFRSPHLSFLSYAADCSKPRKSFSSHSANTICIGFALGHN